jgi:hypothetical protein
MCFLLITRRQVPAQKYRIEATPTCSRFFLLFRGLLAGPRYVDSSASEGE